MLLLSIGRLHLLLLLLIGADLLHRGLQLVVAATAWVEDSLRRDLQRPNLEQFRQGSRYRREAARAAPDRPDRFPT